MRKGIFSASKEIFNPQGPHSQIFMMGGGGGGSDRGSYFLPKKITTSEFAYPKKSLLFVTYPKKSLSSFFATQKKVLPFFCDPKKIPASFIDPKNSPLAKISGLKKSLGPLGFNHLACAIKLHTVRLHIWTDCRVFYLDEYQCCCF